MPPLPPLFSHSGHCQRPGSLQSGPFLPVSALSSPLFRRWPVWLRVCHDCVPILKPAAGRLLAAVAAIVSVRRTVGLHLVYGLLQLLSGFLEGLSGGRGDNSLPYRLHDVVYFLFRLRYCPFCLRLVRHLLHIARVFSGTKLM